MSEIEFPWLRFQLIQNLKGLSDPDYQYRVWVKGIPEANIEHDELDYTIHFLYDDTELAANPDGTVGLILRDAKEAELLKQLVASLDVIFSKYGLDLDDFDYIKLPEWSCVVECAKAALEDIR